MPKNKHLSDSGIQNMAYTHAIFCLYIISSDLASNIE